MRDVDTVQIIKKACQYSQFVQGLNSLFPQAIEQNVQWHLTISDEVIDNAFYQQWQSFIADKPEETSEEEMMSFLRQFRRIHSASIVILELTQKLDVKSSAARYASLADCLIRQAYQWCYDRQIKLLGDKVSPQQNMLILAMGKLGGQELNFSSDIDLIFFYPQTEEMKGSERSQDSARFFNRLSVQLIRLLDQITQDGFVYRVDMRLRPYGESGMLVMSFGQAEEYYQDQGREWERFALLRARILTGNEKEQKQLQQIIRPFAFRRYIDYGVIEGIRAMKSMIQREIREKGLQDNIKLGAGGIREIEFIVQALQLIQGGRDKVLQEANVFKVLPLLVASKMLPEETAESLLQSYRFLRLSEHCIQSFEEKQTQYLPEDKTQQSILAKVLGFDNWQSYRQKLEQEMESVNLHFSQLLGEKRQESLTRDEFYVSLYEGYISAEQLMEKTQSLVAELTEQESEEFIAMINGFNNDASTRQLSQKGLSRLKMFFPSLLSVCLSQRKPLVALKGSLKILTSILKRTAYLELLSQNQPVLQHLVDLVVKSPWITERLSDFPVLLDELLYPSSLYHPPGRESLESELRQRMLRIEADDEEAILDSLRQFKQLNELRVAAALLTHQFDVAQVGQYLTLLAEVIMQNALVFCWQQLIRKHGEPQRSTSTEYDAGQAEVNDLYQSGFAVIGYGKMGGGELGFGSDLDLVFLFDAPLDMQTMGRSPISNNRFYTRLAQKLIHTLSVRTHLGPLYEVDMRLRPSGSSGLLVSHIDAFDDYQKNTAWIWEHQALVRSRFVAGDIALKGKFDLTRYQVLNQHKQQNELKSQIVKMRNKMMVELDKSKSDLIDLKQHRGGLIDIEFLTQYFCLFHLWKGDIPQNTIEGIIKAGKQQFIDEKEASILSRHYACYRDHLNQMVLQAENLLVPSDLFETELQQVTRIWDKYFTDEASE